MHRSRRVKAIIRWAGELQTWVWLRTHYTPDRHVLEDVILPALAERPDIEKVLFVGCGRYTRRYPERFAGREFWTIDLDPEMTRYGAERHVVGSLTDLRRHFEPAYLDAIVCSGVLGWGVDEQDDAEAAIAQCFDCLRPAGILVLGWEEWVPVPPDDIEALRRFEPVTVPPFPSWRYPTFSYTNHTFDFYAVPQGPPFPPPDADGVTARDRRPRA